MQIYQILNIITNKSYVGKSSNYKNRFIRHKRNAKNKINRRLYDSINFHGESNFILILLEDLGECESNIVNEREIYWISKLNTLIPYGYNMTIGGDGGNTLYNWTDEEKKELWQRQSEKRIGLKHTNLTKKIISDSKVNKPLSSSHKERISNTLKKKYASGELTVNTPNLYGANHPGWVYIDIDDVLDKIKNGYTLKYISYLYNTSTVTIGSRLKDSIGKTFLELRRLYGIKGKFSNPKVNTN